MIRELRDQLIADLKTGSGGASEPIGVPVMGPWPNRVTPPVAIVGLPVGPYVVGGQTFPSYEMTMTVVLLVPRNATMLDDLETLVERVLANTADWGLRGVDSPSAFTESGVEILGTTVTLAKQSKL